nr:hypothetical protein [Marinicella sp. W31]MDC2875770.1 hypothetical protein [Marinicella sp. W31]
MTRDLLDLFGKRIDPAVVRSVPVMVPLPVAGPYSYAVPEGMAVQPGSVVQVPVGPRKMIGIVWDEAGDNVDPKKLRPIEHVFDCPPVAEHMRRFISWVAAYTLTPPGLVARMAVRAPAALEPEPMVEGLTLTGTVPERMTPARKRVLELAEDGAGWTRLGLARAAGVSASVVETMMKQGCSIPCFCPRRRLSACPIPIMRRLVFRPIRGGRRGVAPGCRGGSIPCVADRRRDWLGQDRGLFRSLGRNPA